MTKLAPYAKLSDCGRYRYTLRRAWHHGAPWSPPRPAARALWIGLNPSKADAEVDDPTIRKMIGFSDRWGCGSIEVVNLFAFRSTDPEGMADADDPVGPECDAHILDAVRRLALEPPGSLVVAAWGAWPGVGGRAAAVLRMLPPDVRCLGVTASGAPKHPARLGYDVPLAPYPSAMPSAA